MPARLLLVFVVLVVFASGCKTRPAGSPGSEADALAQKILAFMGPAAWERTAAAEWIVKNANEATPECRLLWDRRRKLVRVAMGEATVFLMEDGPHQRVLWKGSVVKEALAPFIDFHVRRCLRGGLFWLNPAHVLTMRGAELLLVRPGTLLVHFPQPLPRFKIEYRDRKVYVVWNYPPGAAYLLTADFHGRITSVTEWLDGGFGARFGFRDDASQTAESQTGVRAPRRYEKRLLGYSVTSEDLVDVKMYADFPLKGEPDPFADFAPAK